MFFGIGFGFDKHLTKDMEKHVDNDAISSEFILTAITDTRCLNFVDVVIIDTHQSKALAWSQFADSEFFAP